MSKIFVEGASKKHVWVIICVALVFRFVHLAYNFNLDIPDPPGWTLGGRFALVAGEYLAGVEISPIQSAGISVDEMKLEFPFDDRGLAYVHLLIIRLSGSTSFTHLQIVQILLDVAMVLPIMWLGAVLGDYRIALASGTAYAVFLPQMFLSLSPTYDTWLTFGFVVAGVLIVSLYKSTTIKFGRQVFLITFLGITVFATTQIRSVAAMYMMFLSIFYFGITAYHSQVKSQTINSFVTSGVLLMGAVLTLLGSIALNHQLNGTYSPVRSTFGHAFWTGIGQYPNPYGVRNEDGVVAEFYRQQTGLSNYENTFGVEYNSWLVKEGIQFVKEYPKLYLSMILRRASSFAFPVFPRFLIVDEHGYSQAFPNRWESNRATWLRTCRDEYGLFSFQCIVQWPLKHPILLAGNVLSHVVGRSLMPLGLLMCMLLHQDRRLVLLALSPLLYIIVFFAPFYGPGHLHISAYAAVLPVIITGWYLFIKRLRSRFRTMLPV